MRPLQTVVCIKTVPNPAQRRAVEFDQKTRTVRRQVTNLIINPLDRHAIQAAMDLRDRYGGQVIVLSMGPPGVVQNLKEALALGADRAYLLCDPRLTGSDTLATSYALGTAIRKVVPGCDVVLCGAASLDSGTAQVGPQLAVQLGYAFVTSVTAIDPCRDGALSVRMVLEDGYLDLEVELPVVLSVRKGLNRPGTATLAGITSVRRRPPELLTLDDINADSRRVGIAGSPTRTVDLFVPPSQSRAAVVEEAATAGSLFLTVLEGQGFYRRPVT